MLDREDRRNVTNILKKYLTLAYTIVTTALTVSPDHVVSHCVALVALANNGDDPRRTSSRYSLVPQGFSCQGEWGLFKRGEQVSRWPQGPPRERSRPRGSRYCRNPAGWCRHDNDEPGSRGAQGLFCPSSFVCLVVREGGRRKKRVEEEKRGGRTKLRKRKGKRVKTLVHKHGRSHYTPTRYKLEDPEKKKIYIVHLPIHQNKRKICRKSTKLCTRRVRKVTTNLRSFLPFPAYSSLTHLLTLFIV